MPRPQPDFVARQIGLFAGMRSWLTSQISELDRQVTRQRRRYPKRLRMPKELIDRFFELEARSRHHHKEYRRFCRRHHLST